MQPEAAIEHILNLARQSGLAEVDVLVERGESLSLKISDTKIEKVDQSTGLGLGVRVLLEGRTGLAHTERLEASALRRVLDEALECGITGSIRREFAKSCSECSFRRSPSSIQS